jgi:hypothetical protein
MSDSGRALSGVVELVPLLSVSTRRQPETRISNVSRTMGSAMTVEFYSLKLSPHPGAARIARDAVDQRLQDWALPDLLDDVRLVTTELVSNAARLGAIFELTLTRHGEGAVLVEVRDFSGGEPALRAAGPEEEEGRGLVLVQACAAEWGWRPEAEGKTTWATCGSASRDRAPGVRAE